MLNNRPSLNRGRELTWLAVIISGCQIHAKAAADAGHVVPAGFRVRRDEGASLVDDDDGMLRVTNMLAKSSRVCRIRRDAPHAEFFGRCRAGTDARRNKFAQ